MAFARPQEPVAAHKPLAVLPPIRIHEPISKDNQQVAVYLGKSSGRNGATVPPINPRGGMVSQGPYTSYRSHVTPKGTNPKDRYAVIRNDGSNREPKLSGARSLPNDSTHEREPAPKRRIGSAPGNKKQGARAPHKPLPKVNTLVQGQLNDNTPRGPAGHTNSHVSPRQEKVSDHNKSIREWEKVRAEPNAKKKENADTSMSYHAKNNTSLGQDSDVQEDLNDPPNTSRVIVMGGNKKPTRQKTQFDTSRDEDIRRTLQKRRDERRKKEQQNLSMQRKNTTFYRSGLDDSRVTGLPRRERTRQIARRKTELITRAKTKDVIREKNLKHFVAAPPSKKDDIDMELYRIEQQMHIYLQTNGMYVDTSELSRLRPESRATDATGHSTTRSDTTLGTTTKSHKSAKKRNQYTERNRNVPPWHRKEYVLNKREADMYQKINKVYRNDKLRENRENAFLKKVEALQVEEWKRLWYKYEDKLREREDKRIIMQHQLHSVRQKYADDRWERIAKFPVNRIAVHDDADRHEYGLPGNLNEESVNYQPKVVSDRKPKDVFDSEEKAVKNKRRYDPIFDVYRRMNGKRRPKMEGVDVFVIDDDKSPGGRKKRRVGVKSLVRDAEDMLDGSDDETEWEDDESPGRSPERGTVSERTPATQKAKTNFQRSRTSGPFGHADTSLNRSRGAQPVNRANRSLDPKYGAYGSRVNPRNAANRSMDSTRGVPKTRTYGPGTQAHRLNESELGKPGAGRFRSNVNDFRSTAGAGADGRPKRGSKAGAMKKGQNQDGGNEGDDEMEIDNGPVISAVPMNTTYPTSSQQTESNEATSTNAAPNSNLQNSATNSKESIGSKTKSKKKGGDSQGDGHVDGSSAAINGNENATNASVKSTNGASGANGSLNNGKDGASSEANKDSSGVQNNKNNKNKSKDAKDSKGANSSNQSQGANAHASGQGSQPLVNGDTAVNTSGSGLQNGEAGAPDGNDNQGGKGDQSTAGKSSKTNTHDSTDGQQAQLNGHADDDTTSGDRKAQGKGGKAGGKGKGKGKGKAGRESGDEANSSKNSNELASNSTESVAKGSQSGHNTSMNKSILVSNANDTTVNGGNKANVSSGSDKENLKPKQGKTVRIISPEKQVHKNTTRAVSPNIGKSRPEYKAPKAFEVKKSDKKTTRAQSPKLFQKGAYKEPAKFEVKKSDKELTKANGPNLGDGNYTAPDAFEVKYNSRSTRPVSPGRGGYSGPKASELKKRERSGTRAHSPSFGRGEYTAPKAFEPKKRERSGTRAQSPNFGRGDYKAPKAFEPKKRERSGTRAQSPSFGRGEYKAPKAFETKKREKSATRAQSPNFGRGEYTAPKAFETTKTERKVTRTQSPTFARGEYSAPKAFEPRKRQEKAATRAESPSFGRGDYKAPKAFEPKKRERSGTRAQSPKFGRGDYKAPPAPNTQPRTRRTRKETTETTKTIRRRRPADYESDEDSGPDSRQVRRRTPPKRDRAPPRRSDKTQVSAAAATQDPQRPDVPTPDLATDTDNSEDDIFEKAKRKYGIVLDDSD